MNIEKSKTDVVPNYIANKSNMCEGHRQRLKEKFLVNQKSFADYEILEMLLFSIFPRKNTRILAKNLLAKFGTLKAAIFASGKEIKKIEGLGNSTVVFFALLKETFSRFALQPLKELPIMSSDVHVIEYYRNLLSLEKKEQMRAMFVNNRNKLIAEEQLQYGTVDQVHLYSREVVQKALDYGSSAIIIVHNHPSGNPCPSKEDLTITRNLNNSLKSIGIKLLDHIIIAENSSYSFASHNLL